MPAKSAAVVVDGRAVAESIYDRIRPRMAGLNPHLAVIQIGDQPSSNIYIRVKQQAALRIGISFSLHKFPDDVAGSKVQGLILAMNQDSRIHGIIIQLPIPAGLDSTIPHLIHPDKDVDGLHPINIGRLAMQGLPPLLMPCTPKSCIELLVKSGVNPSGKVAVIIGRSNIVGRPLASLLLSYDATVIICHSKTADLEKMVQTADIVIAAVGIPRFVQGSWLKPGAVVVDVGINSVADSSTMSGFRLVGDVDLESVRYSASVVTPVPGGVGPVTVAVLMENTVLSATYLTQPSTSAPTQ